MLGREGIHTWDGGAVILNDRDNPTHHRVQGIDGLHSLADFDAPADPATGRRGEIPRSRQRGGKTLAYKGVTRAPDLAKLRDAAAALAAGFETTDEKKMVVAPHPLYPAQLGDSFKPVVNLVTNPSIETNATGWTGFNGAASRSTAQALRGSASLAVVASGTPQEVGARIPLAYRANGTYSALYAVRVPTTGTYQMRISDSLGMSVGQIGPYLSLTAGQWTWLRVEGLTMTANGRPVFRVERTSGNWGTATVHFDAFMLVNGATIPGDYVDGDQPGCSWDGTAHASTSRQTARVNKMPNPSAEIDTSTYGMLFGSGNAIARAREWAASGEWALHATANAGAGTVIGPILLDANAVPITGGTRYVFKAKLNAIIAGSPSHYAEGRFYDTTGAFIQWATTVAGGHVNVPGLGEKEILLVVTAPANASLLTVGAMHEDGGNGPADFYADALQLIAERPPASGYFDGDTGGASWSGTPHASASIQRPPAEKTRYFWARPVSLEMGDDIAEAPGSPSHGHAREFALALRLSDARVYDPVQVSVQTGAIAALGGTIVPLTPPYQLNPVSGNGASVTVSNLGTADVDAILELWGPIWNPVIENMTVGSGLRFKNLFIANGDYVQVDMRARTIRLNGSASADLRNKLDLTLSDWWDAGEKCLLPGNNDIRYRGYSIASPAKAVVKFNPADWA